MKNYFKMNDNCGQIRPLSLLGGFLRNQVNGLTGHIEKAGYPFDSVSWCKYDDNSLRYYGEEWKWVPFEQTAYYLDGASKTACLLKDKALRKKTNEVIYGTFNNVASDCFIGPDFLRPATVNNRWPYTVFFRAVIAKYYDNHDFSLIQKIEDHYLKSPCDYSKTRNVTNIETMLMTYEITKNPKLLELAEKTYRDFHSDFDKPDFSATNHCTLEKEMLSKEVPYEHGVSYNEVCKLGAILYGYTGNKSYLKPAINAFKKIEKFHMQVDGCHSANEFLRGKSPNESHETCDISDYTWSLGYLLRATGDAHYADLIEKCIYNAGIGATLEDFKAFQYFSSVNQIVSSKRSNHCFYRYGKSWMSYLPTHEVQCCAGNVNRFFPNFVSRMYMKKNKNIFVVFYGESEFKTKIGGRNLIISQKTNYPFDENIELKISGTCKSKLNLNLRIPGWCDDFCVKINGTKFMNKVHKGFINLDNVQSGDTISISLPMEIKVESYERTGVVVNRGPILYALGMKGNRKSYTSDTIQNEDYPGYEISSNEAWNYGLKLDSINPKFVNLKDVSDFPWSIENVPFAIEVDAYKLLDWKEIHKKTVTSTDFENKSVYNTLKGPFVFTPKIRSFKYNDKLEKERILLYPYGACKIRIGVFPKII